MSNISEINGQLINAESSSFAATASLSLSASGSLTGSLLGTASWATQALTASLAPNYVLTSVTSSMLQPYVLTSQTSSMSVATASYVNGNIFTNNNPALSSSYALTASFALNGGGGGITLIQGGTGINVTNGSGPTVTIAATNTGGTNLGLVYAVSLGYTMP